MKIMGGRVCSPGQNMDNKECERQSAEQEDKGHTGGLRNEASNMNLMNGGEDSLGLKKDAHISESEMEGPGRDFENEGDGEDPKNEGENRDLKNGGDGKDPKNEGENRDFRNERDSKETKHEGDSKNLKSVGDSKSKKDEGDRKDLQNEARPTDLKNDGDSKGLNNEGTSKDLNNKGCSTPLKKEGGSTNPKNGGDIKHFKDEGHTKDVTNEGGLKNEEQVRIFDVKEEYRADLKNEEHNIDRKDINHAYLKSEGHIMIYRNEENEEYSVDSDNEEHQAHGHDTDSMNEHKTGLGNKDEVCNADVMSEETEEQAAGSKHEERSTAPGNEERVMNWEQSADPDHGDSSREPRNEEHNAAPGNEQDISDLGHEEECINLKNEKHGAFPMHEEHETDPKYENHVTDPKSEEPITDSNEDPRDEDSVPKNERSKDARSGDHSKDSNEEYGTDSKDEDHGGDSKNEEYNIGVMKEEQQTNVRNEEQRSDVMDGERETHPPEEDFKTGPKNECETDLENEDHKTDLKNEGHKTDLKNEGHKTDLENEGHKTDLENEGHKTDLENEGHKTDLENEGHKTDLENEGHKTDLENEGHKTDLKNEEHQTDPKNNEHKPDPTDEKHRTKLMNKEYEADLIKEEFETDQKKEGCEPDLQNEQKINLENEEHGPNPKSKEHSADFSHEERERDLENKEGETGVENEQKTDPKNEEQKAYLNNECETDLENEERELFPKNEECGANPKNGDFKADPKNEECEADPEHEEIKADPENEEIKADPEIEEFKADPEHEEIKADSESEELKADPEIKELKADPEIEELKADPEIEELKADPENEEFKADPQIEEPKGNLGDEKNPTHLGWEPQDTNDDHEENEEEENGHVDGTEFTSNRGKMSGKSKCVLTENGILELYSQNLQHSINVQVIFVATNDMMSYLRLSDGKHVSPVVLLVKKDGKPGFGVGAVLTIHDVAMHIAPGKSDKNEKDSNLVEVGFNQVIIKKYNILQSQSTVGKILGSLDQSATYRDAIRHVQEPLRINDSKFEAYIKFDAKTCKQLTAEGEKAREKGNYYFNKKDFNQAIIHYDIAKKKDPYDHRVWSNCSQALFKLGQYAYAESDALIAIKLNPFHMKAYYRAGQAATKQYRKSTAEIYARSGIFACGSSPELLQLLEEILNPSKKANIEIAATSLSSTSTSVTGKLEQESAKHSSNTSYMYKVTKGTQANIVEVTIHDKCDYQKGTGKKTKQDKGSKENLVHIAGLAQLEERLMNEVHEMWDKGEEMENNKQKGNNHEKEKKAEEKRRNKVEEITKLEEKGCTNEYFLECLHRARRAYEERNFMKAVVLFQQCLDVYSLENRCSAAEPHYEPTLQFLVAATAIKGEPDQPLEAIKIMESLLKHSSIFRNSPAIYYLLALGYSKKFIYQSRNRTDITDVFTIISCNQSYQLVQQYSKKCGEAIKEQKTAPAIKWPGSNDPIPETVVSYMKVLHLAFMKEMETLLPRRPPQKTSSQESDNKTSASNITAEEDSVIVNNKNKTSMARSTPVSRCRFKECLSTQGHDNATEEIYVTDPEFKGYLEVICEENCIISYHPCCWKAHKECQEDRVGKLSDKDFLGTDCITPDCTGKISSIHIYDETGNLKIELSNKKDKKNAQNSVKQKKKKDKKKEKAQANKNADKKKTKHESVSEDTASTEKTQAKTETEAEKTKSVNNNEINSDKKKTPACMPNLPIDPESLESSQVIVLKPTTEREEPTETKTSKKNKKKKNKKNKAIQPDLLGDPLECEQSNQNEYVARLKLLKQEREALENDNVPLLKIPLAIPTRETPSEQVLELLDPDNPFYLPEHLRDNPKALESVLQSKMSAGSSVSSIVSGIRPESITVLLDFMYDWLKSEGPMSITDARIRQCVEENFPPEANTHVVQCGGIKQFLLQSINFAMIDEVICVRDHVVRAQEMMRKSVVERMNTSRYLISDGRRAKKFTHLLDDTKSSCSSSSSASHMAGSGVSYASTGLSGTTTSSVKLVNGEMNNNSKDSRKNVPSNFTSGLDEFDTSDMPAVRPKLNPTAPEFEPRSNDEEEEDFNNELCSEDEEENGKSSSKGLRTPKHSECESNQDPGITTQDGDELFQSDEDEEYADDEEEQYTESLENQLKQKQEQIQTLNDRLYQMKTQMGLEITKLKQQVQDIKEEKRTIQTEKESLSAQRENETKKLRSELSRLQEEMKATQTRSQSLENKCERSNDRANEFEAKLMEEQEVTAQLREEIRNLQESLTSSSRRAHEAEVKYLCTKKDLVEAHLTRTINRLTEEASLMRLLHQTASDETKPDRATLSRSIVAWDDSIKSLRDRKRIFLEEAVRLLGMVNQGRPLNALPLGDLDVPAIPDMSVAPLLMAQQKMSSKPMPKLPIGEQVINRPGNSCSSSPQPVPGSHGSKALLPTPIRPPLLPTALDTRPLYLHNGVNPLAFTGGAIPKRATPAQPSTTPELPGTQKWPDSHQLFVGQLPWEFNEGDVKPITVGNHTLNVQAKESKKPTKPPSLAVGSLASTVGEPATVGSHSAYGLSDISLNASAEASKTAVGPLPSPILHPPSTTTVTKPKFQNLTSNNSVGAIGTPPPKLVRPLPRQPPNGVKGAIPNPVSKDDSVTSTASYKRLIEICKQRVGKEYSSPEVCSALREVRIQNNKSLSGLNVDMIVDRVKAYLKSRRPGSGQATLAPWASLTQCPKSGNGGPEWQGPGGDEGSAPEEQCSICLEALNACPTVPLQCQHVFHEKCIKDWLKRQSNCPNCRTFALMTDEYPSLTHS